MSKAARRIASVSGRRFAGPADSTRSFVLARWTRDFSVETEIRCKNRLRPPLNIDLPEELRVRRCKHAEHGLEAIRSASPR